MKIHWGSCNEESYWKEILNLRSLNAALQNTNLMQQTENTELKDRVVSLCNQYVITASIEESAVRMFNKLSEKFSQIESENDDLKKKIHHLEQTIADYQKAALIEKAPVYVEIAPVEETKPRRARKA